MFTWMSVILRRGKWSQGRVGVLGENEKYLEREKFDCPQDTQTGAF